MLLGVAFTPDVVAVETTSRPVMSRLRLRVTIELDVAKRPDTTDVTGVTSNPDVPRLPLRLTLFDAAWRPDDTYVTGVTFSPAVSRLPL